MKCWIVGLDYGDFAKAIARRIRDTKLISVVL